MLINEWQLGNELNLALQHQHRADFRLWLSLLSPAIEEQANFCLPDANATPQAVDLQQQLQLVPPRDPALQEKDIDAMLQHSLLMQRGGFAAMRLGVLLQPPPLVVRHDAKKLNADLSDNLSLHCQRHIQQHAAPVQTLDATQLFDVLEQLNAPAQAA